MECQKRNSSEEILLTSPKTISSLETSILYGKRKHRHHKSKHDHRRRCHSDKKIRSEIKYSKIYRSNDCNANTGKQEATKQSVSQEILVDHKFKCVINLNTTLCTHKNGPDNITTEQQHLSKDRLVPVCQRKSCHQRAYSGRNKHSHNRNSYTTIHHRRRNAGRCINSAESKHTYRKYKHLRHEKMSSTSKESSKYLKLITDKKSSELDIDEISNKSMENYLDIPVSYKNAIKHQSKCVSKLDTLIKRTKERERKLVEQARNNKSHSPPYPDISSGEIATVSEHDASIHSKSTLKLDTHAPLNQRYSPSIDNLYPIKTETYSPTAYNKDCFNQNLKINMKPESTMGIEAYSPTGSPERNLMDNTQVWFKEEIRFES